MVLQRILYNIIICHGISYTRGPFGICLCICDCVCVHTFLYLILCRKRGESSSPELGFHKEGEHWEFSPDIIQYHTIPYNTMQYKGSTGSSPQTCSINCLSESLKGTSPKTIPPPVEIVSILQVKCQFNLKRPHSLEKTVFLLFVL